MVSELCHPLVPGFETHQGDCLEPGKGIGKVADGLADGPPGGHREHPDLERGGVVPFEDDGKTEDDQEGKKKIPSEGFTVPEKFAVSGIKNGPQSLKSHSFSRLFAQAAPGQL
jgi:hypothetical protein